MKDSTKKLFVISGSSGVGKGTVIKSLLSKRSDIMLSISYTTRKPRPNEKEGINYFGKKIKGFNRDDAILLGVESRTSSPVVIERDDNLEAIGGLYPAGEGAGYAGGITTAAIDGVKVFESIIKKYRV